MDTQRKYYVATWQPGSVGERVPQDYIAGPYDDPLEAQLARDRIGSNLAVFSIVDFDDGPLEQIA